MSWGFRGQPQYRVCQSTLAGLLGPFLWLDAFHFTSSLAWEVTTEAHHWSVQETTGTCFLAIFLSRELDNGPKLYPYLPSPQLGVHRGQAPTCCTSGCGIVYKQAQW